MKLNHAKTGKEEFVEFEFISGRLTEMHHLKTSSATLQLNLTHEAQGKQKVIVGLMKVLEHLKADHDELYGPRKANELTVDEQVSEKNKRGIVSNTFTGK